MPSISSEPYQIPVNREGTSERILYPGRLRMLFLAVACSVVALIGLGARGGGWLLGLLAGIGAVISFTSLLPSAAWLKLDTQGFTYRIAFRTHQYNWADIQSFAVLTRRYLGIIPISRSVCFTFTAEHKKTKSLLLRMATVIARFDGQLPDNYGMKARDLAALMEIWRLQSASNAVAPDLARFRSASFPGVNRVS
ncbi:hypothetical protein [Paludibaculum fermentans]|uniref:Uncharacterized protein n=1 Tax=Paludibaculum fermentans TaxID=1473598 RepID=A0A7S7NUN5_PALFE|nr:hypothetical protein [Paludibaculum fermentans]QOY90058.1 hypothetical protein IRI77_08920 [Paludibaculum fermentans]